MTSFLSNFFIKYLSLEFDLSFCFHFFLLNSLPNFVLKLCFQNFYSRFFEVSPKGCFKIIPNYFLDFFSYLYIFSFFYNIYLCDVTKTFMYISVCIQFLCVQFLLQLYALLALGPGMRGFAGLGIRFGAYFALGQFQWECHRHSYLD